MSWNFHQKSDESTQIFIDAVMIAAIVLFLPQIFSFGFRKRIKNVGPPDPKICFSVQGKAMKVAHFTPGLFRFIKKFSLNVPTPKDLADLSGSSS